MNTMIFSYLTLCLFQQPALDTLQASAYQSSDFRYEASIQGYCQSEKWASSVYPIGVPTASSTLAIQDTTFFPIENIADYDLTTVWIPDDKKGGIGESFEFEFQYPENSGYADAYQFMGLCNLFNGYVRDSAFWKAYGRIKLLKVYVNSTPLCYVELADTWHFQMFDLSPYFVNHRHQTYLSAPYQIQNGDRLRFEIIAVYPGDKSNRVAISGFWGEEGGN